jgi:hypothetical protein
MVGRIPSPVLILSLLHDCFDGIAWLAYALSLHENPYLSLTLALPLQHDGFEGVLSLEFEPSREVDYRVVEQDEGAEDTKVPPNVRIVDAKGPTKLITSGILTVLTQPIRRHLDVSTSISYERTDIGIAGLSWWSAETSKLVLVATNFLTMYDSSEHGFQDVMERCKPVHPRAPKTDQLLWWYDHTTETDNEQEE